MQVNQAGSKSNLIAQIQPTLSLIIVSYNCAELLMECLASIARNPASHEYEVILVDNASKDGTPDKVHEWFPGVQVVRSSKNMGFAGANNRGALQAKGEYFLLLNPDTIVEPGALDALIATAQASQDIGVVGARLLNIKRLPTTSYGDFPDMRWIMTVCAPIPGLHLRRSDRQLGRVVDHQKNDFDADYVSGACMLVRRDLWNRLAGLDNQFFLYFEETDFCKRAHEAGYRILVSTGARVIHLEGAVFGNRKTERMLYYYDGLLIFVRKHLGLGAVACVRIWVAIASILRILADRLRPAMASSHGTRLLWRRFLLMLGLRSSRAGETQQES